MPTKRWMFTVEGSAYQLGPLDFSSEAELKCWAAVYWGKVTNCWEVD